MSFSLSASRLPKKERNKMKTGLSNTRGKYEIVDVRLVGETALAGKIYAGKTRCELKHITWEDDIVDIDGDSGAFGDGSVILIDNETAQNIITLNNSRIPTSQDKAEMVKKNKITDDWFDRRNKMMRGRNG